MGVKLRLKQLPYYIQNEFIIKNAEKHSGILGGV